MEDAIEQIVSYLKHAAQGLEEKKQILYLLGPVGGGKSSLAERLKALMQRVPIYVLSANGERKSSQRSPAGACSIRRKMRRSSRKSMASRPAISAPLCRRGRPSACTSLAAISLNSAWLKSGHRFSSRLPSPKTEPGDENNQDISALVGKGGYP
ncbi:Serine protein kinase (prkA protein) [Klebsiella pneumoniae subsp. ozaenae]|uniref:Serine protein kinase (PrkA protein) n=1 Tax=Klebsiella pneumoniae subsp. ozaenae TaxID=574 RepID=A0A377ZHB2_KLEPO|nr:Serine protein kinase (prkA protein) [Klebsiella pneumoniae subsp. ozaenae]